MVAVLLLNVQLVMFKTPSEPSFSMAPPLFVLSPFCNVRFTSVRVIPSFGEIMNILPYP